MSLSLRASVLGLAFAAAAPVAHAQFAVIDVASVTQLVSQLQTLQQQLATTRSELAQAQAEYQAMTGGRGMQLLLAGMTRNYLPSDWSTLQATLQGPAAGFPALAAAVRRAMASEALLSPGQLAALGPASSLQLAAARQPAALLEGLASTALVNASGRFATLQHLIDAIGGATDQKAILDLTARISAETGMLENEGTKLQNLYQGVQAQQWANAQRLHEVALAGHGQFTTRFQPHP